MTRLKSVFIIVLALCFLSSPLKSAETREGLIRAVETYFANLTTFEADLVQINPDRSTSRGKFYLHRPDRFRLHYKEPKEQVVISDGRFYIEYDPKENIPNFISLDSTPASLLLRPEIKLSGDITVNDIRKDKGVIQATLSRTNEAEVGTMTMVFESNPMRLVYWVVHDAQGNITEVSLNKIIQNQPINDKLFKFQH